ALGRHLVLLHRFQQCALRLGARAVDLVGEDDLREDRARVEAERGAVAVEDRHADDVGRQQVGGELDALVVEPQQARARVAERRLADAGHVLDQQVAAREDAGHGEAVLALLAQDDLAGGGNDRLGGGRGDAASGVEEHEKTGTLSASYGSIPLWVLEDSTRAAVSPRRRLSL